MAMMNRYVAVLHRADSGGWGISFPDFPGCVSGGDSFDEALNQGAQALRFHVEGMISDGDTVPAPRPVEDLRADPEFAVDFDGAVVAMVPLLPPRGAPVRINVSLDSALLVEIDAAAKARGMTRSGFLADAATRAITGG